MAAVKCRPRGKPSSWIRRTTRHRIYARDGHTCVYCGRHVTGRDLTLDHVRPRSEGGTNEARNLVTACRSCNSARQSARVAVWASPDARRRVRNARRRRLP